MFFQQVVHSDLGCASYVVGSSGSGECAVVDPRWEIEPYLEIAQSQGFRITRVFETHTHADHVSGHGRLAAATGARIHVHRAAAVAYPHEPLEDGQIVEMGEVRIHVIHTPGHRPEHVALAVEDTERGAEPWIVLTGDSLLVGDVARPDLAVDGREGARLLFHSLHAKLAALPEFAAVYPAHVAGSLCGRVNSNVSSTTLGYERRYNAAFRLEEEEGFVRFMNENLPQRPPNMGRIVETNRGPLVEGAQPSPRLTPEQAERLGADGCVLLDVRGTDDYLRGHVQGSIHVPVDGAQFGTRVGFVTPMDRGIVLVVAREQEASAAANGLRAVAFDDLHGYLCFEDWRAERPVASIASMEVDELAARLQSSDGLRVLDVREPHEWDEGIIEGALTIPYREVGSADLSPNGAVTAVICNSGARSAIAASLLERRGAGEVVNVSGGMSGWQAAGLPVSRP